MIAFVRGRVDSVGLDGVVVDVGGIGIQVQATPGTLAGLRTGETATLPTSLVVREESLTLYGFADDDERTVFELVQTASGVGPRLAQAMLAVHRPDDLRRAVASEDLAELTKVPGIGKKGAQRIVLELKDRLGSPIGGGSAVSATANGRTAAAGAAWRDQVRQALVGLGWSAKEADAALDQVAESTEISDPPDVSALLRTALRTLSRV